MNCLYALPYILSLRTRDPMVLVLVYTVPWFNLVGCPCSFMTVVSTVVVLYQVRENPGPTP